MASLTDFMYKRAAMQNGSGDPTNPFAAPANKLNIPKVTPFKTDPSYNYHAVRKQVKEAGEGKPKEILKEKRKEFGKQFESGDIKNRADLKDSVQSTMAPGSSRREVRQITKSVAGRTATGEAIRQTGKAIKNVFKSKGGSAMKASCKSGNCKNPKMGF